MNTTAIIFSILSLTLSISAWIAARKRMIRSENALFVSFLIPVCLSAFAVRYVQNAYPQDLTGAAVLKFCASLPSVLYALNGYLNHRSRFSLIILAAIIAGMIADVCINLNFVIGGAAFAAGHLLYDIAFIQEQRPGKKQWILLGALTAASLIPLFLLRSRIPSAPAGIGIITYAAILFSTMIFSKPLGTSVFMAAAVFACSDIFMVINILTDSGFLFRLAALIIYYISLLMYGRVLNH